MFCVLCLCSGGSSILTDSFAPNWCHHGDNLEEEEEEDEDEEEMACKDPLEPGNLSRQNISTVTQLSGRL